MSVPTMVERADWAKFWRAVGRNGGTLSGRNRIVRMALAFKNEPLERWRQSECDAFLLQLQAGTESCRPTGRLRLAALPSDGVPDDVPLYE